MAGSKDRLKRLLILLAGLLALGAAYAWAIGCLGEGLPCPFYRLTGLLCPGCGVSRMCMALLRSDWAGAWEANPAVCILSLPIAVLLTVRGISYVRGTSPRRWEGRAWMVMAGILLAFGVIRNLPL